ncbi:MAG: recR [Patescibacteria group bacterium]|nr:recR [Patescibacteria group bacterium]
MDPINNLTDLFIKFPGIGRRQAKRFAYFIIQSNPSFSERLAREIVNAKNNVRLDPISFQYFTPKNAADIYSPLTLDTSRDSKLLMIVEKDVDIDSIEKSRAYHGRYFVLGGLAPLIDTDLESTIRVRELEKLIEEKGSKDDISEIIFALSANPEGDRTTDLIKQKIVPLQERFKFNISQLGRGFSTGTEVEYSDADTLANALENRK